MVSKIPSNVKFFLRIPWRVDPSLFWTQIYLYSLSFTISCKIQLWMDVCLQPKRTRLLHTTIYQLAIQYTLFDWWLKGPYSWAFHIWLSFFVLYELYKKRFTQAAKPKIDKFDDAFMNQYILKFDISVYDIFLMKIGDSFDELITDILDSLKRERIVVFDILE